jgi:hypothetical protein
MMIPLPVLLEQAWARALPGRECASQNEVLRANSDMKARRPSGRPSVLQGGGHLD